MDPNKDKIIKLCKEIEKKEGVGKIFQLDNPNSNLKIERWSTGIEDLDHITGGGFPKGRIVELFGIESAGKTSLSYHLASMLPLSLVIPIEGSFDTQRAKSFGNSSKNMIVYRAMYGEDAMEKMIKFSREGIPLIILDSVPACLPHEDVDKVNKDVEDNFRMGGVARLMHKTLPVLSEIIEFSGTTIILINQVRDKIGAMMFGDKLDTPGGHAIKHYSSIRMMAGRKCWIEIPNKDPRNSASTEKIGMVMKVKIVKSKVCNPMGEMEIPLMFSKGFVSFEESLAIRKQIMSKNNIKEEEEE